MTGMKGKTVVFAELITVHDFPMVLGDNPACSSGAPVQLDWQPCQTQKRNLEMYEFVRREERKTDRRQLLIPVERRGKLLLRIGFSIEEIAQATMDADETKEQRQETLRKQGWDRMALILETTGKIPKGIMKGVLGTTGDILSTTGGLLANTGGLLVNTGGMVVSATVGGLASTGRKLSKSFGNKPKTIQARSA
jgi:hypothetical protein